MRFTNSLMLHCATLPLRSAPARSPIARRGRPLRRCLVRMTSRYGTVSIISNGKAFFRRKSPRFAIRFCTLEVDRTIWGASLTSLCQVLTHLVRRQVTQRQQCMRL